ncbi:hypothetical protein KDK95_04605 [Actinospica sp. MGRD01-02]|uniref:Uncharacterized protein n=1 Tax=Actinospica acidithermotolerans TaxID=2828514 RepID=A0A941E5N1_9ACTN|nr:hypothetical protein [Actinospica acidithermotolerans]MBR7825576.1 hypothetical protein [Actinospica acidithermotolerans]
MSEQQGTKPDRSRSRSDSADDGLRHIICFLCYPAFETQPVAPHDAQCICGKRVKKGDAPASRAAPQCILCDELAEGHYRRLHDVDE